MTWTDFLTPSNISIWVHVWKLNLFWHNWCVDWIQFMQLYYYIDVAIVFQRWIIHCSHFCPGLWKKPSCGCLYFIVMHTVGVFFLNRSEISPGNCGLKHHAAPTHDFTYTPVWPRRGSTRRRPTHVGSSFTSERRAIHSLEYDGWKIFYSERWRREKNRFSHCAWSEIHINAWMHVNAPSCLVHVVMDHSRTPTITVCIAFVIYIHIHIHTHITLCFTNYESVIYLQKYKIITYFCYISLYFFGSILQ